MYSSAGVTPSFQSSWVSPHIRHNWLGYNNFIENGQNTLTKHANPETFPKDTCGEVPHGAELSTAELNPVIFVPF